MNSRRTPSGSTIRPSSPVLAQMIRPISSWIIVLWRPKLAKMPRRPPWTAQRTMWRTCSFIGRPSIRCEEPRPARTASRRSAASRSSPRGRRDRRPVHRRLADGPSFSVPQERDGAVAMPAQRAGGAAVGLARLRRADDVLGRLALLDDDGSVAGPFQPLKRTWKRSGQTPIIWQTTWPISLCGGRAPCSRRCGAPDKPQAPRATARRSRRCRSRRGRAGGPGSRPGAAPAK
jgi:hypothetical protein